MEEGEEEDDCSVCVRPRICSEEEEDRQSGVFGHALLLRVTFGGHKQEELPYVNTRERPLFSALEGGDDSSSRTRYTEYNNGNNKSNLDMNRNPKCASTRTNVMPKQPPTMKREARKMVHDEMRATCTVLSTAPWA